MLSISRQTEYACRIILHLATCERATAHEIARQPFVPRALARRIVTQLANAQLVVTTPGREGDLALARPPSEISLLDVIEAIEGPLTPDCCALYPGACDQLANSVAREAWTKACAAVVAELKRVTVDKLSGGLVPSSAEK
jgi:Rrf2 family protein